MVGPLTLPEEFALLSLADTGKTIDSGQAKAGCAVAELGELALRGKLLIRQHEPKVFGLNAVRQVVQMVELIDAAPVGLAWADELLAELAQESGAIAVGRLLWRRRRRGNAFHLHRGALVARGLVRHVPSRGLFRRERYLPDPTLRTGLIDELRLAAEILRARGGGRRLDAHAMFLSDMVIRGELDKDLGIAQATRRGWRLNANVTFLSGVLDNELELSRSERRRARKEDPGTGALGSLPEPLRHTSAVLGGSVPKRSRHRGDNDDFD
jgi:hypothetical protein